MVTARRIVRMGWPAGVLAAALALAGCGASGEKARRLPCPDVLVLSEAGQLARFAPGAGRDATDLLFRAEMAGFRGHCEHFEGRVEVVFDVLLDVRRGAANTEGRADFEYFVALPRFHPAPEGKRNFAVAVSFEDDRERVRFRDRVRIEIPLGPDETGASHDVYLGLQLSRDELEFNRRSGTP